MTKTESQQLRSVIDAYARAVADRDIANRYNTDNKMMNDMAKDDYKRAYAALAAALDGMVD